MGKQPNADDPVGALGKVLGGLVTFGVLYFGFSYFVSIEAERGMNQIENQVAEDFERQYRDVSRYGSALDKCVQAGMVSAGHLQAGNTSAYARWKTIESNDCRAAGLNR